tara:strand:+ start:4382 stop:4573 length:192 start_codon:yes stop_codon:yes gene_type:complete
MRRTDLLLHRGCLRQGHTVTPHMALPRMGYWRHKDCPPHRGLQLRTDYRQRTDWRCMVPLRMD